MVRFINYLLAEPLTENRGELVNGGTAGRAVLEGHEPLRGNAHKLDAQEAHEGTLRDTVAHRCYQADEDDVDPVCCHACRLCAVEHGQGLNGLDGAFVHRDGIFMVSNRRAGNGLRWSNSARGIMVNNIRNGNGRR